jgi:hypothetical protein
MSAERLLDDLARTLAEPMPRRRAIRVIGASLAAIAVPGVSPRFAQATAVSRSQCGRPGGGFCLRGPDSQGKIECKPCGWPLQRYSCGRDGFTCVDECPPVFFNPYLKKNQRQTSCSSSAPFPEGRGQPKAWLCCKPPVSLCDPDDPDLCLPDCRLLFPGEGYEQCGSLCCPPGQECRAVKGKKQCVPCANTCKPPRGKAKCCARGEKCCFNNTTAACCGPTQTCHAANRKQATCTCDSGTKCGPDCCKKGEACCSGLGTEQCCKKGEECCHGGDCCGGSAICCDLDCCDHKKDQYCLVKVLRAGGINRTCKTGCAAANKCGPFCCGTGTRCVKGKCVP